MLAPSLRAAGAAVVSIADPSGARLIINGEAGQPLVTVHCDGTLTYGAGYTPDEVATAFWEALAKHPMIPAGDHGVACGHPPVMPAASAG